MTSSFLADVSDYDFIGSLIGDKSNSVVFDNTKLKRLVPGFTAEIRLDQGIRRCVEYILAHPEYQTLDPEFDEWCDKVVQTLENAKKAMQ